MKTVLFCAALLCGGVALAAEPGAKLPAKGAAAKPAAAAASSANSAAELAEADALFAKKAYPEALQKYTKLANAGNVMAQQHLGEMYFYGEAGAVDMDKAAQWFQKAAAKGNAVAIASLALSTVAPSQHLQVVWACAIVFVLARACFWVGYRLNPLYRAPGMAATAYMNLGMIAYVLFRTFSG